MEIWKRWNCMYVFNFLWNTNFRTWLLQRWHSTLWQLLITWIVMYMIPLIFSCWSSRICIFPEITITIYPPSLTTNKKHCYDAVFSWQQQSLPMCCPWWHLAVHAAFFYMTLCLMWPMSHFFIHTHMLYAVYWPLECEDDIEIPNVFLTSFKRWEMIPDPKGDYTEE